MYTDDPVADAECYMEKLDDMLKKRPVCDCCGEHIQDDNTLHYKGTWLCKRCMKDNMEDVYEEF